MKKQRYMPFGALALEPRAFGGIFDLGETKAPEMRNGCAVVDVRGPLLHHPDFFFDSYDAIKARVAHALEMKPRAVILSIDSPGGLVSGCFDTAKEIRDLCDTAGVELHAYVDGQATSAAYALAAVCRTITIPSTGVVGSIGVIDTLLDASAQDAMMGLSVKLVASGVRKLDGNPHLPISGESIMATQERVNQLADVFFLHVASFRGTLTPEKVRGLEAGLVLGAAAVSAGLADKLGSLEETLAAVATGSMVATAATEAQMASKGYEECIAGLRKIAEGDDEEAAKAKKMLAAELSEDDKEEPAADSSDGDGTDEPDKKPEPPAASAPAAAPADDADAKAIANKALALAESTERARLLATRPDFASEMVTSLEKAPLETVRDLVRTIPRTKVSKPAATATPQATRGEGQGSGEISRLPAHEKHALDVQMGLVETKPTAQFDGHRLTLGAPQPAKL